MNINYLILFELFKRAVLALSGVELRSREGYYGVRVVVRLHGDALGSYSVGPST